MNPFSKTASASLFALAAMLIGGCAGLSEKSAGTGSSFKGPIGLQLYSLRADFAKDVPGTMARVHDFGLTYVETAGTYNKSPEEFKKALADHGLQAISGHFPYERYRDDAEGVAHEAQEMGLKYAGCAWITHTDPFDEKQCHAAAAVFNHAGEVLARHGIKFFYHTHGYEFQRHGTGTLFDLLMSETKPEFVHYEMDVFWVIHPGQSPEQLLGKYGSRFELMHVKDMKNGTKGDFTGHSDVTNDVALGTGKMNWPAILAAAKKAGVKWYFIEDESPDSAQHIPVSLHFLEQVQF
jgi:sugar phosphate isomerase/epimerase